MAWSKKEEIKDLCVIGATVNSNYGRTWFDDEEAAVEHAKGLLVKHDLPPGKKFYVVKVVKVVELEPPPMTVRGLKKGENA